MKKILLFLLLLCAGSIVMAQETIVTGTVVSADGELLPGASVIVKGTMLVTVTDMNGNFAINLPTEKATLVFKFIGFSDKEQNVTAGSKGLRITLSESSKAIGEVVVIGYGSMKRSDLTGSVASIGEDIIKKSMTTSLESAMQGRIAGVQVTQNSGQPGGGISVSIRGINSLNGNEPLYVIDGVPLSGQGSSTSALASINPNDIVTLDVLKGASATAIYGSQASNGVVMITTKRGEAGKPKITYNGTFGLQQIPTKLAVMDLQEYAEYYNKRAAIQGWGIREDYRDPTLLGKGTDWQSELFRSAPRHEHFVGLSGGSGGVRYSISGGYLNEEGIGLGSGFRRFTFRSNMDMDVTKWLTVSVNGSIADYKQVTTLNGSGLISTAITQRPDIPARNPDGSYGDIEEDQFNTYYENPLAMANLRENFNTRTPITYNFSALLKILPGLNLRAEYGGSMTYNNSYSFTPDYKYGSRVLASSASKGSGKNTYWLLKTFLTYDVTFAAKNKIQVMAGHEAQESADESLSGSRAQYLFNNIHSLNVGNPATAQNGDSQGSSALESYLGRLIYNFADRYLLTATLRADGSSTFGPNNRWGYFPSAALAWQVKNESFMNSVESISKLKLRLEWGISGNRGWGYNYGVSMASAATYWGTGFFPNNYGNPNLQWEKKQGYNIGLELGLFKNRVNLVVDAYDNNQDNLLMQATLPNYVVNNAQTWIAIDPPWVNSGMLNNKGLEFSLNTHNIDSKDLSWTTGFNISFNRNKIVKLYSDASQIAGPLYSNTIYTMSRVGEPLGQIFGYNVNGMFTCEDDFYQTGDNGERIPVARPADSKGTAYPIADNQIWVGDYIFEDVNKDGIINQEDRKILGNTLPKFTFGFANTISWKNFELYLLFNGVYGNKVYNVLRANNSGTGGYSGKLKEVAGYARVEKIDPEGGNDISNLYVSNAATATASRIYAAGGSMNDNERISSRFTEDGSFIRLQNIRLSYTFPREWVQKIKMDHLQIYASSQNLFVITKYKGYDPEVGDWDIRRTGLDFNRYPTNRVFTFGLTFNF